MKKKIYEIQAASTEFVGNLEAAGLPRLLETFHVWLTCSFITCSTFSQKCVNLANTLASCCMH